MLGHENLESNQSKTQGMSVTAKRGIILGE